MFVLGGWGDTTCEMLDLSDDDPHWRYIAKMNSGYYGGAVVIGRKIYVACDIPTINVEVYDIDQGILMKLLQIIIFDIYRSVEDCYDHANLEKISRCSST